MNTLTDVTITNPAVQINPATADNHLLTLAQARALVAALYTGAWSGSTNYLAGQMATDVGGLYIAKVNNLNKQPSANPTQWGIAASGGAAAYVYVAYANDGSGTGFSNTDATKPFMAVKATTSPISSPAVGDFSGLWKQVVGAAGTNGTNGSNGTNGTNGSSAFVYIAFASASDGTGFSLTPNSSLPYIAVKSTTTAIGSPGQSDFAGLWVKYKGTDGAAGSNGSNGTNGTNGAAGASAYFYIAYCSDGNGAAFSLTPAPGLSYVAYKTTSSPISSPQASDFAGLWKLFVGTSDFGGSSALTAGTQPVRIAATGLQFYNFTTAKWHTLLCTGNPPQIAWDGGSST